MNCGWQTILIAFPNCEPTLMVRSTDTTPSNTSLIVMEFLTVSIAVTCSVFYCRHVAPSTTPIDQIKEESFLSR